MSTTPPPPFGYTQHPNAANQARFDRNAWKAQRRAAAAQARLQQAQFRLQMRAARRSSLVGPLLLLAIGTTLLLLETGRLHWPDALTWLGRWWPAILIFAGLVMTAEWFWDRQRADAEGTMIAPRRTLGGGTVFILLLLAGTGVCGMVADRGSNWAQRNLDQDFMEQNFGGWQHVLGSRREVTEELHAPLAPTGSFTVDNPRGDITVSGSSQDGEVHVTVHQHLYSWHHDGSDGHQPKQPRLTGDRDHLQLTSALEDNDDADLTIELPHDAPITIHGGHGDISLEELRGPVTVSAAEGDVKLTALRGPVHVEAQDDDATITAHSLGNGLTVTGRTGDINLTDIEGPVEMHGDFFGTTHLERVQGAVNFQSSFTHFTCAAIPGDLNIEGRSDLDAHRLEGPVIVSTTNRNLTLDGVRGGATIEDRNGSVTMTLAQPLQPVRVNNSNGSVELAVPASQAFAVQASTQNGEIHDEFGLAPQTNGSTSQLAGQVRSGGPEVRLQTTEGDITVRHTTSDDAGDWADTRARLTLVPPTPADPAKHHNAPKHLQ